MKKTTKRDITGIAESRPVMPMEMFVDYLGAGRYTANKVAELAEAKIYIGRRLLINVSKVEEYLAEKSE